MHWPQIRAKNLALIPELKSDNARRISRFNLLMRSFGILIQGLPSLPTELTM